MFFDVDLTFFDVVLSFFDVDLTFAPSIHTERTVQTHSLNGSFSTFDPMCRREKTFPECFYFTTTFFPPTMFTPLRGASSCWPERENTFISDCWSTMTPSIPDEIMSSLS